MRWSTSGVAMGDVGSTPSLDYRIQPSDSRARPELTYFGVQLLRLPFIDSRPSFSPAFDTHTNPIENVNHGREHGNVNGDLHSRQNL